MQRRGGNTKLMSYASFLGPIDELGAVLHKRASSLFLRSNEVILGPGRSWKRCERDEGEEPCAVLAFLRPSQQKKKIASQQKTTEKKKEEKKGVERLHFLIASLPTRPHYSADCCVNEA